MNFFLQAGIGAVCLGIAFPTFAAGIDAPSSAQLEAQMEQFLTDAPGSIYALQPFRADQSVVGPDELQLKLTSLNPGVNAWFILEVEGQGYFSSKQSYHLENADPDTWQLSLVGGDNAALMIEGNGDTMTCDPWVERYSQLDEAQDSPLPFAPICDGKIFLRNKVSGNRTNREAMADFLRNNIVFGDSIVNLIKGSFYEDAFMQSSETVDDGGAGAVVEALGRANLSQYPIMRAAPGFDLIGTEGGGMEAGSWYAVENTPGIYASVVQPGLIHGDILGRPDETNRLDGVERRADVHLVAFDMENFEIGYEPGTGHPNFGWSSRPSGAGRNYRIPGPDGINSPAPLIMTGMLSPAMTDRVAATFTGGYKRDHGAFRYGPKATFNHGHHYGFFANGVMLSKLHPGLSTMIVKIDGTVEMRMWTDEDYAMLPEILFARQNGVPLIEPHPETGEGVPGSLVRQWGAGNWSGSADAQLRTVRGGACLREVDGRTFLIYAYFSTATPSGMARTFQAYSCDTAMLLDMNSQEHTYMALYPQNEDSDWIEAQHLVRGMQSIDQRRRDGTYIPRFVGYADNRDFFYILRKE